MSRRKGDDGFGSATRLRNDLVEQIDTLVDSETGKRLGYRSRADFIDKVLREKLHALQGSMKHLNTYEDHVKIVDFELRRIVNIFLGEDGLTWCDLDETERCPHTEYVLSLPEVQEVLEKKGWKRRKTQDENDLSKPEESEGIQKTGFRVISDL